MSRCFPSPPAGYVRNGVPDEALVVQSIKLQRDEEKAKKDRKKEKKREKKEKSKAQEEGEVESRKHKHKKRHREEKRSQEDHKKGECQKSGVKEVEHFEKSSLTEEHGHPVGSQNSTDSTLNSNKRPKVNSPSDSRHNSGSILRIRLPIQRHKDPEVLPIKEQPCSTSGRTDAVLPSKEEPCSASGSTDASARWMHAPAPVPRREQGLSCSTSKNTGQEPSFRPTKDERSLSSVASLKSNLCSSCSPSLAQKFRDLVELWVPPGMPGECTNLDDQDWLSGMKPKQNQISGVKRCESGSSIGLSNGNSNPWPYAQFLPEADIYALPFTLPF